MCGIAFIYQYQPGFDPIASMRRMVKSLQHRGPDENNLLNVASTTLGHTRLSIVDIESGQQPMQLPSESLAITFNGEIYNFQSLRSELEKGGYQFKTHCDTEVLLQAYKHYGTECLQHLRGMFSFAIADAKTDQLFIARDRLGIKPLFYYYDQRCLIGASEIKAIFASGLVEPRFNLHSIRNYFNYDFSITPHTPFESIYELPVGHCMHIKANEPPAIQEYWDLQFNEGALDQQRNERYWQSCFEDKLKDAVCSHTIGDVPIGTYLSGGIDSATSSSLLHKYYPQCRDSFTIRFLNPDMDESEIAKRIAEHVGLQYNELSFDDAREQGYLDDFVHALYHLEQPQKMAVDIPHIALSNYVRRHGYKVVYTGDGSDELFGGYDCYRQDSIRIWGNQQKNHRQRRRYYLDEYKEYFAADHMRLLHQLHQPKFQKRTIREYGCYPAWYDFWQILNDESIGLFQTDFLQSNSDNIQMQNLREQIKPKIAGHHPLNQSLYIETKTRLPGWILWKSDRLSMANGVEVRVPFVDHRLAEFTAQLPPYLKLNGMNEKYILHQLMAAQLPEHPQNYKKRAFYTPIKAWFFSESQRSKLDCYLNESVINEAGVFNFNKVEEKISELMSIKQPNNLNEYYKCTKLEWALMLVLSVQILHHLFIKKQAACFQD